ncbi:MAG: hypothetical protein HY904_08755 [Deltaproteobacteria bacterium]|nr:hypothetical protein [Deltaproteobacteria bacterium]
MNRSAWAFAAAIAGLAAGCSNGGDKSDAGSGNACDSGPDAGDGGCGGGSSSSSSGQPGDAGNPPPYLSVGTAGIYATDNPVLGERAVEGDILVEWNGSPLAGATVTLNGSVIPPSALGAGFYDVGEANLAALAGGSTLELVATATTDGGTQTAQVTFACPGEVAITSPAPGTVLTGGQAVDVTWSGTLTHSATFGPAVGVYACFTQATGDQVSQLGHGDWFVHLTPGQSTAQVAVPPQCARLLMEIRAAGDTVLSADNHSLGLCYLQRRSWMSSN